MHLYIKGFELELEETFIWQQNKYKHKKMWYTR